MKLHIEKLQFINLIFIQSSPKPSSLNSKTPTTAPANGAKSSFPSERKILHWALRVLLKFTTKHSENYTKFSTYPFWSSPMNDLQNLYRFTVCLIANETSKCEWNENQVNSQHLLCLRFLMGLWGGNFWLCF